MIDQPKVPAHGSAHGPADHPADTPAAQEARQCLSAFMDGDGKALGGALKAWREDAAARQAWHRYHLLGDVLRSEDLARRFADDQAFLHRLRSRLQDEPAWVAPAPVAMPGAKTPAVKASPKNWFSMALAAGLAAFAVVVSGRLWVPAALQDPPTVADATSALPAPSNGPTDVVLRDPRLDEFLRMHQVARGGMPVVVPGGGLRNADYAMPSARP